MKRYILALLAVALIFSGCAFSYRTAPLNYHFDKDISVPSDLGSLSDVYVPEFRDFRGVLEDNVLVHKVSLLKNKTSGAFKTERPFKDIIRDAVITGLNKAGVGVSEAPSRYMLEVDILSLDFDIIVGVLTDTMVMDLSCEMYLKDTKEKKILWQDIVTGRTKKNGVNNFEMFLSSVRDSIDDLVIQLVSNEYFLRNLSE